MRLFVCGLFALAFFSVSADSRTIVKFVDKTEAVDPQKDYYIEVLRLALEKSRDSHGDYVLQPVAVPMLQNRQLQSLHLGMIDVVWTMTSQDREDRFTAVKIPLLRGLMGYRVSMILKESQPIFDKITTTEGFKRRLALQGHDWPDMEILTHNGYRVRGSSTHENFFAMLLRPDIQHIPRNILEGYYECENLNRNVFSLEAKHLLVYPTAIYFFTSPRSPELAERLYVGLKNAQRDGSFDALFLNYPMHKPVFDSDPIKGRLVHCLENPLLPEDFPIDDRQLWMDAVDKRYAVCDFHKKRQ
ncbi:hypothetical protein OE749_01880 [Aestuariibacter sp. AA17]|uniref:Bacterial extracellular solute-binding proteins, family 3 n=1 Tax=Fluctibacter corallii TaxID=2984329 RepID=A0ABT3A425_9ALTE|nr:hypothetical protein [Aestuariibacter sp. AA17]MCV2883446.1 hypothetical protein [Aestuariibacter sp. AA17]